MVLSMGAYFKLLLIKLMKTCSMRVASTWTSGSSSETSTSMGWRSLPLHACDHGVDEVGHRIPFFLRFQRSGLEARHVQ